MNRRGRYVPVMRLLQYLTLPEGAMKTRYLAVLLSIMPLHHAHAWGQSGHAIIAEIAQREVGEHAGAAIDRLLGHASLASVASWADDVKFEDRPETKAWHFVNIPLARDAYDPAQDCGQDVCVVAVLDQLKTDVLCARGDDAKRDALRFAVHLVGDLTQPLHTVLEGDGGNNFDVTVGFCGLKDAGRPCTPPESKVKFHALWDDTLIDATVYDWGAYVRRLYAAHGWLQSAEAKMPDPAGDATAAWANDTHRYAPIIWTRMLPASNVIDRSYYEAALPVLDRQLGIAGLRLARFLDEAYGGTCSGQ
jgi:hypothetical protein